MLSVEISQRLKPNVGTGTFGQDEFASGKGSIQGYMRKVHTKGNILKKEGSVVSYKIDNGLKVPVDPLWQQSFRLVLIANGKSQFFHCLVEASCAALVESNTKESYFIVPLVSLDHNGRIAGYDKGFRVERKGQEVVDKKKTTQGGECLPHHSSHH